MDGFIFYTSFLEAIQELPNDSQLRLYQAITNFALNHIEPENLKSFEKAVFTVIKPQLIANQKRYENGKKGGRPKKETIDKPKEKPKEEEIKTNGYENKKPMVIENENLKRNIKIKKEKEIENKKEIEIKKENSVKEKSLVALEKATPTNKQVYEFFNQTYKKLTNADYLFRKEDYILIANLIKKYGIELVIQKIKWLEVGCVNSVFWFAKNESDFTVSTLQTHWNRIIPILTEAQKKELAKKKKQEELEQRINAELMKDKMYSKGGTSAVI